MSTGPQKTTNTVSKINALEFKSSTFSMPVLVLSSDNLAAFELQLQEKIGLAPEFFKNTPLVIDFQEINKQGYRIDVKEVVDILRKAGLLPVGIRGGNTLQNKKALELLMPIYSSNTATITAAAVVRKVSPLLQENDSAGVPDVLEPPLN